MAKAIFNALEMKVDEKSMRLERMQKRISGYNVFTWAYDFFTQTYDIKNQQELMGVKYINTAISAPGFSGKYS